MMFGFLLWSVLFITLSILFWLRSVKKPERFPPGPPWLPMVGCLRTILDIRSKKLHLVGEKLEKIYGQIVGLKLGGDKLVIVSEYSAVREVLNNESFEGRPDGFFFRLRSFGKRLGLVFVDGPFMMDQRKFCLNELRSSGLGRNVMDEIILSEAREIVYMIASSCETDPVKVQPLFDIGTLNTLWTLVTGERFSYTDSKLFYLINKVHECFHIIDISGGFLNKMPFLRFIAPSLSGYNLINKIVNEIMDFFRIIVEEHEKSNSKDFIGAFLEQIRKNEGNKNTSFTKEQLLVLLEDLFMAGMETTSSTLSFVILYLIQYPDIQRKIHEEMDEVLSSVEGRPTVEHYDRYHFMRSKITFCIHNLNHNSIPICAIDRFPGDVTVLVTVSDVNDQNVPCVFLWDSKMAAPIKPAAENKHSIKIKDVDVTGNRSTESKTHQTILIYLLFGWNIRLPENQKVRTYKILNREISLVFLKATIMEVQRHANPVPITIPHRAMKDAELNGYKIPKDTFILPSLWSLHMNEKYWNDPKIFCPDRFIEDGEIKESKYFLPFGMGRRKCIGETLAKRNIFLFLCVILESFRVEPTSPDEQVETLGGFTQVPAPFEAKFIPRR